MGYRTSIILSRGVMMRFSAKIFIGCLLIVFISGIMQAEEPLASEKLIQALTQEVSGERAFDYTVQISQYDRIQACKGWHDAAVMIKKELDKIGYTDVAIEGWPSNGSRYYFTYRTPIGWSAKNAELWMVIPEKKRLCSYEEIPLTLAKHSNSADVEAELIDVGTGVGDKAYEGKDVKGKIVLATEYTGSVMKEAVLKRGALGVVHWLPPEFRPGYPDMIRYTAIWPTWEEKDKIGFGFNLSKSQGWNLKMALEEGKKVVLRAKVEAEYYDGPVEVLSAAFPGSVEPEKEVMIIGHLCHPKPSANDNASGSGGMLEMARALKKMVDNGQIEPPKRTIRFLWVPEFGGTYPYIQAHLERMRNTLSVINCDMIGEDLHLTGGIFNIFCTPDSMPSFLNDVVVNFTRLAERSDLRSISGSSHPFAYRVLPFSGGSDHYVFNDGALKVPSVMFNRDDIFHHTSLDTMDKVDPTELRRVCFIALGSAYYLADASDEEAKDMARLVAANGLSRLAGDYYDSLLALEKEQDQVKMHKAFGQVTNVIQHSVQRERDAVLSTLAFVDDPSVKVEIQNSLENIKNMSASFQRDAQGRYTEICKKAGMRLMQISLTEEEKKLDKIVPVRDEDFVCPLNNDYVVDKLGKEAFAGVDLGGYKTYEALNFVDGKRSVLDIAKAVSAEYGPVDPQVVFAFFRVLEKAELLTFKK
jgi:aminopeptidase YwaD